MKECEKHTEQLCCIPGRVDTVERKNDFRRGWKAALNWWLGEGSGGNIRFKDVDVRIELIEKELLSNQTNNSSDQSTPDH